MGRVNIWSVKESRLFSLADGAKSVLIFIEGSPGAAFLKAKVVLFQSLVEKDVAPRYRRVM